MILKRLQQALQRQDWFAVLLEVIIVVVGVVIGFQVTAWGNERAERVQEQVLLVGLREDFVQNRTKYERTGATNLLVIEQARELLSMTGPLALAPDPAKFDSLLHGITFWSNLDPIVGRLNALLQSGQIAIVQSDSLQAALSAWPAVLENMQETERLTRDNAYTHLLPFLWKRYPLLTVDKLAGLIDPDVESAFPEDRQALLTHLEFANLVEDRWANAVWTVRGGEQVRLQINEIIRLIDSELTNEQ